MSLPDKEWYTMEEFATAWGVNYTTVQRIVSALSRAGTITTRRNPADYRVVEISKDSVDTVKRAVTGQ